MKRPSMKTLCALLLVSGCASLSPRATATPPTTQIDQPCIRRLPCTNPSKDVERAMDREYRACLHAVKLRKRQ